jgi:hypothetical protein
VLLNITLVINASEITTMSSRRGAKIGWTGGWLGGLIWVAGLSMIFIYQQKWLQGFIGLFLACAAVICIIVLAPWRHPSTPYGKLMLGPYGVFFASVLWAVWAYGGIHAVGIDWWTLFWFLPLLIPIGTVWKRRWSDSKAS